MRFPLVKKRKKKLVERRWFAWVTVRGRVGAEFDSTYGPDANESNEKPMCRKSEPMSSGSRSYVSEVCGDWVKCIAQEDREAR
jgi:hypothetical protein